MATTRPVKMPLPNNWVETEHSVLFAGALVPMGTPAVNDGGVVKAATDTLIQGGALLLGIALDTYDASASGSNVTVRMRFARGVQWCAPKAKSGDVPGLTEIGKSISLADNDTVKKTVGGSDVSLRLDAILTDAYVVFIP